MQRREMATHSSELSDHGLGEIVPGGAPGERIVNSARNDSGNGLTDVERLSNGLGKALPASRVVAQCFDEQVSPTQILVLPVFLLPGRDDGSGRPGPDDSSFRYRNFRRRHLLFRDHWHKLPIFKSRSVGAVQAVQTAPIAESAR